MKIFITSQNRTHNKWWTIPVWIIIWELLSFYLQSDILLVAPHKVLLCFFTLITEVSFWNSIGFTFFRIALGFLLAVGLGCILGALSGCCQLVRNLLWLPISIIRTTPVASIIILILIWIPARNLSIVISFLIAFPIIYLNIQKGFDDIDKSMLEMAKVFRLSNTKRLRYIYLPELLPCLETSLKLSLGFCWKSGIAAELLGLPKGSIGERIYQAKIYLETPELFAWTFVVILLSYVFEKLVLRLISYLFAANTNSRRRNGN